MTIKDEIIAIANQLANQGKKPTVALIKNKLSGPTSLPTVISTLKSWQHEPERTAIPQCIQAPASSSDDMTLTKSQVMELITPMQAEIKQLKALVIQLQQDILKK